MVSFMALEPGQPWQQTGATLAVSPSSKRNFQLKIDLKPSYMDGSSYNKVCVWNYESPKCMKAWKMWKVWKN